MANTYILKTDVVAVLSEYEVSHYYSAKTTTGQTIVASIKNNSTSYSLTTVSGKTVNITDEHFENYVSNSVSQRFYSVYTKDSTSVSVYYRYPGASPYAATLSCDAIPEDLLPYLTSLDEGTFNGS